METKCCINIFIFIIENNIITHTSLFRTRGYQFQPSEAIYLYTEKN